MGSTCILVWSITSCRWIAADWWSAIEIQQRVVWPESETDMAEASSNNLSAAGAWSNWSGAVVLEIEAILAS